MSAEGLTLNQCANGGINDPVDHLQCHEGWISGNANQNKAAYREGEFLPNRVVLTGLTAGSAYTYEFSWDTLHSGKHALDYIGTYDFNVTNADACQGLSASICTGTVTTTSIPADPTLPFLQTPGHFTLFGGILSPLTAGDYTTPAADERGIRVSFIPDQPTAVIAWGGHISSPLDWGNGNTASDISGSPYHTQNKHLSNSTGAVVASGGRDVQLSAAAVFVPARITVTKTANTDGAFSFESFRNGLAEPPSGETNPWTLMTGESTTLVPMDDGEFTIAEVDLPEGAWRIKSIICSELGEGEIFSYVFGQDGPTDSAVFDVVEAGTYECVFDNEFFGAPALQVIKKVIGPDEDCSEAVRDGAGNESRTIYSGESVKYCYWVNNTGSDGAIDVTIEDDMGTAGTGDDVFITLSGGSDIDGEGDAPDLSPGGEYAHGESVKQHLIANGTTITNVATAEAIGAIDQQTYSDTDDASVTAGAVADCGLTASVTIGVCPGSPTVVVLEGASVNWCATIAWDNGAVLDLTNIYIEMSEDASVNTTTADVSPGGSVAVTVGSKTAGASDFTGTLVLTASEGGINPKTCQGQATVDVIDPGLQLTKLASLDATCGNADDADMQTIFLGESVWYCLTVENTGDVPLEDVLIDDDEISLSDFDAGDLAVAQSKTFTFGPFQPSETVTNTATASATEPQTGTMVGPQMSSATVEVLAADIEVEKDVDPAVIVICEKGDPSELCTAPNPSGHYDAVYIITVTNHGPSEAFDVSVEDELPFGFIYDSDDGSCLLAGSTLECFIGDMAVGAEVVITVLGEIDASLFPFPWQNIRNQACANPMPPMMDPDPSNNCDDGDTDITTGPTHTIGYWGSHPQALNFCMDDGPVDLGFLTIKSEKYDDQIDATVSTGVGPALGGGGFKRERSDASRRGFDVDVLPGGGGQGASLMQAELLPDFDTTADEIYHFAKGIINANPARWKNLQKRSDIDQARTQAARQLTAAWCNEVVGGAAFAEFFLGWENIRLIMAGRAYLDGGMVMECDPDPALPVLYCDESLLPEVISSIEFIAQVADLFNNSGGNLTFPFPPAPADPHAPEDDPTDPSD